MDRMWWNFSDELSREARRKLEAVGTLTLLAASPFEYLVNEMPSLHQIIFGSLYAEEHLVSVLTWD